MHDACLWMCISVLISTLWQQLKRILFGFILSIISVPKFKVFLSLAQLLRVPVLQRRGEWAVAPSPIAPSPSHPSPPARRTSLYSTHASSARVNTHKQAPNSSHWINKGAISQALEFSINRRCVFVCMCRFASRSGCLYCWQLYH